MTVLQKLKADLERFKKDCNLKPEEKTGIDIAIEQIGKYAIAEKSQIIDAHQQGQLTEGGEYYKLTLRKIETVLTEDF